MYPQHCLDDALERLALRRSVKAMDLQEPGPNADELKRMLEIALRVPDHGKLGPWRFLTFADQQRDAFGAILANRFASINPNATDLAIQAERNRFNRAPTVVAVIANIKAGIKIPEWEQQLSVGAACQNLLIAANLSGFAAQWLTEWYAFDEEINAALALQENERVAAYIYIGSAVDKPPERVRPNYDQVVAEWQAP